MIIAGILYLAVLLVSSTVIDTGKLTNTSAPLVLVSETGPLGVDPKVFSAITLFALANGALTGKTLPFITVAVETEPPYIVRAYRYTDGDLDQGRAQWHEALREYAARDAANDWTVPAEIELIALPAWYAPDEDMEF